MNVHHHLGAYVWLTADGSVLLVHNQRGPYESCWDLPGGGLEAGEAPEEALRRETREETGLLLPAPTFLAATEIRCCHQLGREEPEELRHVAIFYEATLDERSPAEVRATEEDISRVDWHPVVQLSDPRVSPLVRAARRAVSG